MAEEVFFRMREIDKIYPLEGENVHALKKVSLTVEEGDYLSVLGPSGSGKTTLMNIIGCLDTPTSGETVYKIAEKEEEETGLAALFSGLFTNRQVNRPGRSNRNGSSGGDMPDFSNMDFSNMPGGGFPGGGSSGGNGSGGFPGGGSRGN